MNHTTHWNVIDFVYCTQYKWQSNEQFEKDKKCQGFIVQQQHQQQKT